MNAIKLITLISLCFLSIVCEAEFKLYDALLYKHKPDLSQFGVAPIPIIYESTLFSTKNLNTLPNQLSINRATVILNQSQVGKGIVDIERWPTTGSDQQINSSLLKYKKVISNIKSKNANVAIGYYGAPPVRDYWRAISGPKSQKYINWQTGNNKLQSLADTVDILYPSLYTFYDDQQGWIKYAEAQISEARRLAKGKPVIVFLWPKYHDSNRWLKNNYISSSFWRLQLETAKSLADGIVIWGGWQEEWNPNAPWWAETLNFIAENNL